jgi:sporulation protein YlmC with PRC-barrel domain
MPWAVAAVLLLLQGLWMPAMAQADFASLSQDEKMARRFPQPVRVGDLIGLPVLDDRDVTIGKVSDVVRTPAGRIQLIVPYGGWFAKRRPVAVPIETVVILGRHLNALEFPPASFDKAPTFVATQATPIDREETIRIALGRR